MSTGMFMAIDANDKEFGAPAQDLDEPAIDAPQLQRSAPQLLTWLMLGG